MPSVGAFHETGSQGGRRPSHAVQPSQDNRAIIQQLQRYWDTRGTPHRERLVTVTYVCAALPFRWILRFFSSRRCCRRCRRRFSAPVFLASALPCFSASPHEKRCTYCRQTGRKGRDPVDSLLSVCLRRNVHGGHERGNDPPDTLRQQGTYRRIVSSYCYAQQNMLARIMGFIAVVNPLWLPALATLSYRSFYALRTCEIRTSGKRGQTASKFYWRTF